jgi:predicted ATP-grasp superfamily ATP-dependent carboligase
MPAIGLWARVPHYVSAMPYPEASARLIDGLAAIADLSLASKDLHESAARTRVRIDELIANSEEHRQLVAQLEAQVDREAATEQQATPMTFGQPLPSGDEIAAELERFLRGDSAG